MTALIALFALLVFNVLSVGAGNWPYAWDNAARLGFWWVVTAAIISVRQHTPLRPVCIGLVLGMTARFAFEAYWFVTNPGFALHPSYQFGVFTSNPNTMAGLGASVLPIAAGLAVARGSRATKLVWSVAAAALLLGIVVSFSKGSWLAAAAGAGVWVLHGLRTGSVSRRTLLRAAAAAVLLVLVIPAARRVPGVMLQRWTSHGSAVSNQERLRYVETAVSLILEHPLAGVGLERFGEEYLKARRLLRGPDDPHNAYLMVAVELGIPALAALLIFQGLVVMSAFVSVREGPVSAAPLYAGLSAGVIVLLVFQMFSAEPLSARTALVVMALGLTLPGMADRETALT
jgi:O-antigen ligase